ncbi:1-hydroxycarotenoid 3,4-desaturase CrtD [Mangrovibacterium sp.]|uniref:1-hydroxycarotenoid 3,4-desaturase CrtD n=1 Tax=Mangrovibacterium sp. TaxID=1961364 RepID=UPI0035639C09
MKKAAIVGAGIAGLAVAVRLARSGWEVTLFEKSARVGGKLNEFSLAGFRFDTGPSLFTLPGLLDELLDDDLRVAYRKLELVSRYFYEDGTILNAFANPEQFAEEVESKTSDSKQAVLKYLSKAAFIYRLTAPIFIFSAFQRLKDLLTFPNFWRALQFPRIQAFRSLHQKNSTAFSDPRLVQLFDRFATYNGSNPYQAPATLQVIAHLEHNVGAYFPDKGMYSIVEALQKQAQRLGVQIRLQSAVQQVVVAKGGTKTLLVNGQSSDFDLLVSDVDIHSFYRKLLTDSKPFNLNSREEASSSALIFYWGMKKTFPQLELHNIFFSENYADEFDCLFRKKTISPDPTVYVYVSSKQNHSDAPEGMENWFVMVNAPSGAGPDWATLREQVRKQIIGKLNRILKQDVEQDIVCEEILDPTGLENKTSSLGGAIYGASSNSLFSAFRRHPNFRNDLPGVYFVGGSVHPGGGIPLCLASAKIVGRLVDEKEGKHEH